jgi:hypothetical protein
VSIYYSYSTFAIVSGAATVGRLLDYMRSMQMKSSAADNHQSTHLMCNLARN